jgi:predicted nucleic acid-binding protein
VPGTEGAPAAPRTCVLDADVVIGWLERGDAHHVEAVELLAALAEAGTDLCMTAVNYAEVLVAPAGDPTLLMRAIDALRAIGVRTLPVDGVSAVAAAITRNGGGISLADAFALTAAQEQRATLATFDRRVRTAADREGVPVLPT